MNKPVKRQDQTRPEGYSPKEKPELLSLVEKHAQNGAAHQPYEVKTANGGNFIDGVPLLKWGEWKDNSYCGCVTALLQAIGIPVSYEEVMGLSGVCYQAIMLENWDPSSQMPQNGMLCEKNVGDALGLAVYTLKNEKKVWERAQKSIDGGVPVLLVGGRWAPEWTIACGYAAENGETKFFGRTYFDCQNNSASAKMIENQSTAVPENEIYTPNKYFYLSEFPGWAPGALTRFYDKTCKTISRKQALKTSLEMCINMFEQPPRQHGHKFGFDAYDVLISGFELGDTAYQERCGNDHYHLGSMQDARRAAYRYLAASADLLNGANNTKLLRAAEIYKKMLENMLQAVPYEETTPVFNDQSNFTSGTFHNRQKRQELAAALKENKELERKVRELARDILANWGR